ncbi:uncharacterized protein LOC126683075 [Mercurialis annua]|uniref:uncharacterized protein LOC126683075 n=1 Tax=Mercurialis annua TaxID=3986 RepID=UPI00215E1B2F|nr:uncharacterized protein LOC126683075 [Mercurialis annua]XP_050234862.1 uncharacterized protein LOC126683075 [Mercurialis annua]
MTFRAKTSVPGQFPEFGAIFMCNTDTKKECLERKLLGLPSGQANFVRLVKTGMILFLYEFEKKELFGVFQACSDGAIDIVPHAFESSGKQFPAQVEFTLIWHCSPLPESEFRHAIRENYFSANKFHFGLSEKQVLKLLSLFDLRKVEDKHFTGHFTQSKVPKQLGYVVEKTRNAVDDGSCSTLNIEQDEENGNLSLGSIRNQCSGDYINDYIRGINAQMPASGSTEHEHDAERGVGLFLSNKQFRNPICGVGKSGDSVQLLTSNEIGRECHTANDPRSLGPRHYPAHSFTSFRSTPNHVTNTMISDQENKRNEHNDFVPFVSTKYPDLFQFDPIVHPSKYISQEKTLNDDQPLQYSATHRSVVPEKLNVSHSPSPRDAVVRNTPPYDPDAPALDYMHSSLLGIYKSGPEYSVDNTIFPHLENQSLLSNMEPQSTSRCSNLDSDVTDVDIFSKNMYSVCEKKRASVFSRLAPPPASSELRTENVDCGMNSSVDEVMTMLHQSHFDWVKENNYKKLIRSQVDIADKRKKRQVTVNSRLSKNNLATRSRDKGAHNIISGEDEVILNEEKIPLLDFKRRSEVQKSQDDASSRGFNETIENNGDGQPKRRKLVRPNFNGDGASSKFLQGVEFSNNSCPLSPNRNSSNSIELNSQLENVRKEFKKVESVNSSLLGSIEPVSYCSMSEDICRGNIERLGSDVGKECKVNIESNRGSGNVIVSSCCENISGCI